MQSALAWGRVSGASIMDFQEINTPVVLFVFRRIDTVKLIFEKLQEIKPKILYVFSDGPRPGRDDEAQKVHIVREFIQKAVNWDCELHLEYAAKNKGCAENICSGIDKVFQKEISAIILEDDAVPMKEFFIYCQYLLAEYQGERRVQYIAGFNAVGDTDTIPNSYAFSKSAPMSGAIATWADRWNQCDFSMKNWPDNRKKKTFRKYYYFNELYKLHCSAFDDSYKNINDGWDYQFHHDQLDKQRFAIVPKGNLVKSYGYTEGAFHPQNKTEAYHLEKIMNYTERSFDFPMHEPKEIVLNREYDRLRQKLLLGVKGNYVQRHVYYLRRKIKDLAYRYLPKKIWNLLKGVVGK